MNTGYVFGTLSCDKKAPIRIEKTRNDSRLFLVLMVCLCHFDLRCVWSQFEVFSEFESNNKIWSIRVVKLFLAFVHVFIDFNR